MSAFEDVVEAWGFKIAGDKPAVLSPAGIAPDGSIVYSDAESFRDLIGAEPELGNPSVNGWILSSSSAGVRSWVAPNAHSHAIADVTGLQSALDARMSTASYPDLVAIEALAGTSGLLRKTAANTWSLDTASYALSSAIPVASSTTPSALGTAAVGTGTTWARADHVHAMPTAAQVGAAASGHNHTLDSLSNVTISSNSAGEILRWNGTAWVNATLAEAGIQPAGSYLTGNQTITLSGIVTGSGATSITTSIADAALSIAKTNGLQAALDAKMSTASYPDLVAIEALAGTSGLLRKTAANAWSLDTATYLTGNQTITLSGDVSGSGSISIAATVRGITVTEHSANNTDYPVVWDNTERALFHTAAKLKFNPSSGSLWSTIFSSGLVSTTSASFVGNWASSGYWGFAGSTDSGSSAIRAVLCSNLQGAITSLASLSVDILFTGNNGNGTNIKIGDDAWIGDINMANVIGLKGVQDGHKGYIQFGSDGGLFGYNGSRLTYDRAFEVTGMSYATGGCTVPQGANVYLGSSQIARQADYVGLWGLSAVWQFGRSSTVFSSPHAVSATFNEGIDALGVSYFSSANVTTFAASEATLGKVKYTPDSITTNTTLGENSLYLIDSTSDLTLTLPSLSLVRSIKIAVKSSGSYGHTVVPTSGYISWSGMRINGDYLEFQAYPEGAPLGNALRLKPGLYEFIAVSSTCWLCSSSPRIP
jgi:hypothetical protein